MLPRYAKPQACTGCSLETLGRGYAPGSGPLTSPFFFLGEALGGNEAIQGEPFIGAAGGMLGRIFKRAGILREDVRITNCVMCQPPGDWLDGAPWEYTAREHCKGAYLDGQLAEWIRSQPEDGGTDPVLVALGGTAMETALGLRGKGVTVQNFHGTVHRDPTDRYWVVPSYHPSFLQRGATNLLDVVRFDLSVAKRVAGRTFRRTPVSLLCDPPLEQFAAWARAYRAQADADPDGTWLAVDIETPDKAGGRDEGELTNLDRSFTITRVNFSCHPDEGLTAPYIGEYIYWINYVLASRGIKLLWHYDYDLPRLVHNGSPVEGRVWDLMWAWHKLQSDLPRGLGFVAPFYSDYGAWKHLATMPGREAEYAAADGLQTYRLGAGIVKDLVDLQLWPAFERHVEQLDRYALKPAESVGVLIDLTELGAFKARLEDKQTDLLAQLKSCSPPGTLRPKAGYAAKPEGGPPASILGKKKGQGSSAKGNYIAAEITLVERELLVSTRRCSTCEAVGVSKTHKCARVPFADLSPTEQAWVIEAGQVVGTKAKYWQPQPAVTDVDLPQARWFWQLPFNPDSPQQLLASILGKGHQPGKAKKTKKPTTNAETLRKLARATRDPFYQHILDYRGITKVHGTYVVGIERRLGEDGRVHSTFTHKPSTHRLSSVNPNLQNVITDRGGPTSLAAGFRKCVVAAPGCRLLEVDYSGIEAVETGWFSGSPAYIRLATLGVHAYLASHLIGRPADLAWSDADLAAYFSDIKKREPIKYDKAKRCVHGNNYGLTVHGMHTNFPDVYPTLKDAKDVQTLYYDLAPALPAFHRAVREYARQHGYLGGPYAPPTRRQDGIITPGWHPYSYRHWFWAVLSYKPITAAQRWAVEKKGGQTVNINGRWFSVGLGEDSKRVIAFYPQSTSAGVLKDAMLLLFHPDSDLYIGDQYYGKTPLRAPVHDSLLLEVPDRQWDRVVERVLLAMRRPLVEQPNPPEWGLGPYLRIGVEAKAGTNWLDMKKIDIPDAAPETASELMYSPPEEDEMDDDHDLGTQIGAVA